MERNNKQLVFNGYWASQLLMMVLGSCTMQEKKPVNAALIETIEKRKNNPHNIHLVDSAVGLLQTGDIVVRTGNDMTSYMLRQLNHTDKTYSHCGLVMIENGYPFVYHSIGGEDNPDQVLRRDSADFWFSPGHNIALGIARLQMPEGSDTNLRRVVTKYYKEHKKFDMDFDIKTDDRFYCAEFVYKSVNNALTDSTFIKPITVMGYTFVGIDNLFMNEHARFVAKYDLCNTFAVQIGKQSIYEKSSAFSSCGVCDGFDYHQL